MSNVLLGEELNVVNGRGEAVVRWLVLAFKRSSL